MSLPWLQLLLVTAFLPQVCSGRFDYPNFKKRRQDTSCQEYLTEFPSRSNDCPHVATAQIDAPKDSSARVCDGGSVDHQNRLALSLINKMYMDCSSWCVYDVTDNAATAYQWSSSESCYEPVTKWLCFEAAEHATVQNKIADLCQPPHYTKVCDAGEHLETGSDAHPGCLELHYDDPVNNPDQFNRRLRCRCPKEPKDSMEGPVIRSSTTAVHCSEPRWSETTIRIERALLNGMYKSCDNWCLFDIYEPDTRFWTWNPFSECWDDSGQESVCDKLVTNYGEELQYAQKRSKRFCGDLVEPRVDFSWHIGDQGANCQATCEARGMVCFARAMVAVSNHADSEFTRNAFSQAGLDCSTISGGDNGITGTPAVDLKTGHCVTTAGSSESGWQYCARHIAGDFSRLCSCSKTDATKRIPASVSADLPSRLERSEVQRFATK